MFGMPLFPQQASNLSQSVDLLYAFLTVAAGIMSFALAALVIFFAIRYRRRDPHEFPPQTKTHLKLELGWTGGTLVLFLVIFFWSARVYFAMYIPPKDALEVFAIGKQWMWKVQHPGGQREINALHVPVGVPVRITLASQDVIHSFYIPAFRVKQDAVPGRYTTLWFTATKAGRYHLFCTEYCGMDHSRMIGYVQAMERDEFAAWLVSGAPEGSLASQGAKLFRQYACANCHDWQGRGPGPSLSGVFNTVIRLEDGTETLADPLYVRESILRPMSKVVLGFRPIMPTFEGQLDETQLIALIEFIRSVGSNVSRPLPLPPVPTPPDRKQAPNIQIPGSNPFVQGR